MQFSQRINIFEDEIIKRVREIQKYSKGLNTLVRKSVMPDLEKVQEQVSAIRDQSLFKEIEQRLEQQRRDVDRTLELKFGQIQE